MIEKIVFCGKEIPVHSIVDVITNSSSTVYVWPTKSSIETMSDIIQRFMTTFKIPGKPEDHFKIEICVDPDAWEEIWEEFENSYDVWEDGESFKNNFEDLWNDIMPEGTSPVLDYKKDWETVRQYIMSLRGQDLYNYIEKTLRDSCYYPENIILKVTPIGDPENDLVKGIMSIFSVAAIME